MTGRLVAALLAASFAALLCCRDEFRAPAVETPVPAAPEPAVRPTTVASPSPMMTAPQLIAAHCGRCHPAPTPRDLPKSAWPFVVRWMGHQLGVLAEPEVFDPLIDTTLQPPQPALAAAELLRIENFLVAGAPTQDQLRRFREVPARAAFLPAAGARLVRFNRDVVSDIFIDQARRELIYGSVVGRRLVFLQPDGVPRRSVAVPSEVVAMQRYPAGLVTTHIGHLHGDAHQGAVARWSPVGERSTPGWLLEGYHRTAHSTWADLNGDGRDDLVVAGFGNFEGRLAWFAGKGDGIGEERVLAVGSGWLGSAVADFTGDGKPDVLALKAQGWPSLRLYVNDGKGRFREQIAHEGRPGSGYNGLQVADFNGDGHLDALLVAGDNRTLVDMPVKPQHGLHILLGDGHGAFTATFFYPMPGALRARVADLDGDALLDIVAIAYFPDWAARHTHDDAPTASAVETFVILKQVEGAPGELAFTRRSHPDARGSRWSALDVGDLDGDGRVDVALGNSLQVDDIPSLWRSSFVQAAAGAPGVLLLFGGAATASEAVPGR